MHFAPDMPGDSDLPGYLYLRSNMHGVRDLCRHADMRDIDLQCQCDVSGIGHVRGIIDLRSDSDMRGLGNVRGRNMR